MSRILRLRTDREQLAYRDGMRYALNHPELKDAMLDMLHRTAESDRKLREALCGNPNPTSPPAVVAQTTFDFEKERTDERNTSAMD